MRASALLCLGLLAGCASTHPVGIVPDRPLTLSRSSYVLPPEPPPPEPRSVEEQRRLEIEWPEVRTYAVTTWPRGRAPSIQVFPGLPACDTPGLAADVPCQGQPRVHSARAVGAKPVVVRVQNRRADTLPMVLLEVR